MRDTTHRAWSLLLTGLLALTACDGITRNKTSTDSDSTSGSGPSATLLFQVDALRVEDHPYPDDTKQDRSFISMTQPTPVLASETLRQARNAIAGAVIPSVGGFTLSQAGLLNLTTQSFVTGPDANFLNYASTDLQVAFGPNTSIRIPFSQGNLQSIDVNTLRGAVQIYDLGYPLYNPSSPASAPVLLNPAALRPGDTFQNLFGILQGAMDQNVPMGATPRVASDILASMATAVAVGEIRVSPGSNAALVRPSAALATTNIAVDPTGLGFRTYGVLVQTGVRTAFLGNVVPSAQYQAVQANDVTGLPASEQASVLRYIGDTAQGFGLASAASGLSRSQTLAYFQITVRDHTLAALTIRETILGNLPVDRRPLGGGQSETITTGGSLATNPFGIRTAGAAGFDGDPTTTADNPQTLNTPAAIEGFHARIFGPYNGTVASATATTNEFGNTTSVVTVGVADPAGIVNVGIGLNPGGLEGGILTLNPGTATAASFSVFTNSETTITVNGNVPAALAGATGVPYTATRADGLMTSGIPQAGPGGQAVGTVIRGFIATPNIRSPNFPQTNGGALPNTFLAETVIQSAGLSAALSGGNALQVLSASIPPLTPNDTIVQFPQEVVGRLGNFVAQSGPDAPGALNGARFTNNLPYLLYVPASAEPTGGYPVAVAIHGFGRRKEDYAALAATYNSAGIALLAIDITQHGERQNQDGDNSGRVVLPGAIPLPDNFLNVVLVERTETRFFQYFADVMCLLRMLRTPGSGMATDPNLAFDPNGGIGLSRSGITLVGQSLGGITGTVLSAIDPSITRATLNVPGASLLAIVDQSSEIAPGIDGLLLAVGSVNNILTPLGGNPNNEFFARNSGKREVLNVHYETLIAEIDPACFATRALAAPGLNLRTTGLFSGAPTPNAPPGVLLQFVANDSVVPNEANAYLARSFGVGDATLTQVAITNRMVISPVTGMPVAVNHPVLFDIGLLQSNGMPRQVGMNPFTGNAITQFTASHGALLSPDPGSAGLITTASMQTGSVTFNATGSVP